MKRMYQASLGLSEEVELSVIKELRLGYLNLSEGMFEQARLNFIVALTLDNKCADAAWGAMLCKLQAKDEDDLTRDPITYKNAINLPEYKNAIDFADEAQKKIFDSLMEGVIAVNAGDNY